MKFQQNHNSVSVEGELIFIGRFDGDGVDYGKVFVFDISDI